MPPSYSELGTHEEDLSIDNDGPRPSSAASVASNENASVSNQETHRPEEDEGENQEI